MPQKKTFTTLTYVASIIFLPWWVYLSLKKIWNPSLQIGGILGNLKRLNDIKEKNLLEKFIELEELFFLDKMIKEYRETHIQKLRIAIHKKKDTIGQDAQFKRGHLLKSQNSNK